MIVLPAFFQVNVQEPSWQSTPAGGPHDRASLWEDCCGGAPLWEHFYGREPLQEDSCGGAPLWGDPMAEHTHRVLKGISSLGEF